MWRIFIILYFVIGLYVNHVGTSALKEKKSEEMKSRSIEFFVAQVVFILFWPLCLLLWSGGDDDE